jgi:hypothetical protein
MDWQGRAEGALETLGIGMNILRSIGAVLAGLVVVVVLSEGLDIVIREAGLAADKEGAWDDGMLTVAFIYRSLAGVCGGFVAAALAPEKPMVHAIVLGVIGLCLSTLGAVVMWGFGHQWYPIALAVIALPAAWLGGWIQQMGRAKAQA